MLPWGLGAAFLGAGLGAAFFGAGLGAAFLATTWHEMGGGARKAIGHIQSREGKRNIRVVQRHCKRGDTTTRKRYFTEE